MMLPSTETRFPEFILPIRDAIAAEIFSTRHDVQALPNDEDGNGVVEGEPGVAAATDALVRMGFYEDVEHVHEDGSVVRLFGRIVADSIEWLQLGWHPEAGFRPMIDVRAVPLPVADSEYLFHGTPVVSG